MDAGAVAFHLDLPVLNDIPVATLVRIRCEEEELFRRFQARLRQAVDERARVDGGGDPVKIAGEIKADLIEPELARIRERLTASERLMNKKAGVGAFLATLTTTCGLLAGAAPVAAVGVGLAITAQAVYSAASKHLEERRDAELEDMYFLWKAVGHAKD